MGLNSYFTVRVSWMGWSWSGLPVEDMALGVTVIVEVPEGVMTGGGIRLMPPPPQPAMPRAEHKTPVVRIMRSLKRLGRVESWNSWPSLKAIQRTSVRANEGHTGSPGLGLMRSGAEGGKMAEPLVVTVTVNGAATPFEIDTLAGSWQAAPKGAPLHVSDTVPLYPAPGVNCSWYWAGCPALTEAVVEPPGAGPGVKAGLALPLT